MDNLSTYNKKYIVKSYLNDNELQPPEKNVFSKLANFFKDGYVLDIGVGGGRTTKYLQNKVGKYIGIDYSKKMIEACRNRFP